MHKVSDSLPRGWQLIGKARGQLGLTCSAEPKYIIYCSAPDKQLPTATSRSLVIASELPEAVVAVCRLARLLLRPIQHTHAGRRLVTLRTKQKLLEAAGGRRKTLYVSGRDVEMVQANASCLIQCV